MSARQRRQFLRVVDSVSSLVIELSPHIIDPSPEKQRELGIADKTLLVRVGTHRVISVCPTETGAWCIKEFDSITGDLVPVWDETADLPDELVGPVVLAAAIGSLQEQLDWTGEIEVHEDMRPVLARQLAVLRQRHSSVTGEIAVVESADAALEFEDSVG